MTEHGVLVPGVLIGVISDRCLFIKDHSSMVSTKSADMKVVPGLLLVE